MAKKIIHQEPAYAIEKYTRNIGTVGRKKIVFVGASYLFVHRVFRDMILVGGFDDIDLVVNDIDPVPLKLVCDLLEKMARQAKVNVRIIRSLDKRTALKDADVVLLSITTGGWKADYKSAVVSQKYGIPVTVGDTMGPVALFRNLREIPVVVDIIHQMQKLCPKALMLNFTNPMSAITGAMARCGSHPVYGLCHSADGVQEYFSKVFHVEKEDIKMQIGGVNHQAFLTNLKVKGVDRTEDIEKFVAKSQARVVDGLSGAAENMEQALDIFKILKVFPSCSGGHLAEFYGYFFHPKRIGGLKHELHKRDPGRKVFPRKQPTPILKVWAYGPEPVGDMHLLTNEHAHELMWSYLTGEAYTRSFNTLNTGEYIKNLPKNACVEIMATMKGRKLDAKQVELPPAAHSIVQRWVTIHDLSIKAALSCDREAAEQAMFLDAHTKDMYAIRPMMNDFLKVLRPWLSKGWYK